MSLSVLGGFEEGIRIVRGRNEVIALIFLNTEFYSSVVHKKDGEVLL